jgi:hypothetical protein
MPKSTLGTDLVREIWPLAQAFWKLVFKKRAPFLLAVIPSNGTSIIGHPVAPIVYPAFWLTQIISIPRAIRIFLAIFHPCGQA